MFLHEIGSSKIRSRAVAGMDQWNLAPLMALIDATDGSMVLPVGPGAAVMASKIFTTREASRPRSSIIPLK
jgi:phospholipid N-methyltransferase